MQNMESKLCSVIMPAYNCQQYIDDAIHSVLCQTYSNLELIVIDDCSSDHTLQIAMTLAEKDTRIHIYHNDQNLGVAGTRNRGFSLATGEYIALLDADDIWLPEKLEEQIVQMKSSSASLCYSSYSFVDEHGLDIRKPYIVPEHFTIKQFLIQNYIGCSTAIFRHAVLADHRMSTAYAHEDYVFWLELLKSGCTVCGITKPLVKYRISAQSRSAHKGKAAQNRWKIYRRFLKLSFLQSVFYFVGYTLSGIKKHFI